MDPDTSSIPDDLGLNTETDPTSHDEPSTNLELPSAENDYAGIHSGPSSLLPEASGHLRCINCGLNITRMRRHVLEIAEVRNIIQQNVQRLQVQVTSDNVVCHSCWSAAWNIIRNPSSDQQNIPIVGHGQVCINCGKSLLRIRSHMLNYDTSQQELIRNIIARQIAPRELPSICRVCHNCWRRTHRAASHSTPEQESGSSSLPSLESEVVDNSSQQQMLNTSNSTIILPNYIRAPITENQCFFPGCTESERLVVPSTLRVNLLCDFNYYIPQGSRICNYHLTRNSWDLLLESTHNPIKTFSAEQIEDFASLVKSSMKNHLNFEQIHTMDEHTVHYYLGVSKLQFHQILSEVPRLANKHKGAFALAAYLMKLRTGDSDDRISSLLQVPRSTLERHMNIARQILSEDFAPRNLGLNHITREEIAQRNLLIPNGLFGGEERKPIIIADGTYLFIEKSSNYLYQKKTYSLHKYRNLIKPFLIVASDGYIIDILGPYPATTSDADIVNMKFSNENSLFRQYFQSGDVFILDRGFRDSLPLLQRCGYEVHVPLSVENGETQLTTRNANKSRAVTMCRWVVEVVNGIFKTAFKIFRQNYFNRASKHAMIDFTVAGALINKFHARIRDRDDAALILERVNVYMETHNHLSDYVRERNLNRARAEFTNINVNCENVRDFPILSYSELILIACGTYQLKQARSYYGEHIRDVGCYQIDVCNDNRSSVIEGDNISSNCSLIRARIASRHITRKVYFVYILISSNGCGLLRIKEYCCNCIVGRRTVGCCAHVMTVIWYLGWARHQNNIFPPAQFLDDVLIIFDNTDANDV